MFICLLLQVRQTGHMMCHITKQNNNKHPPVRLSVITRAIHSRARNSAVSKGDTAKSITQPRQFCTAPRIKHEMKLI